MESTNRPAITGCAEKAESTIREWCAIGLSVESHTNVPYQLPGFFRNSHATIYAFLPEQDNTNHPTLTRHLSGIYLFGIFLFFATLS
jgi:hypothetical protein